MRIFLVEPDKNEVQRHYIPYILVSYYTLRKQKPEYIRNLLTRCDMFLLDSGAFTFMNSGVVTDFDAYLTDYIKFINDYDIKYFFELDLDTVIGLNATYAMTARLERETGKQSIPVFHKVRGIDGFKQMCETHKYIAIASSGKNDSKWTRTDKGKAILIKLLSYAHAKGVKVHGLGYTKDLDEVPFDTVDSTTYRSGGRFGELHQFKNGKLIRNKNCSEYKVNKDITEHNLVEWIKYSKYKAQQGEKW